MCYKKQTKHISPLVDGTAFIINIRQQCFTSVSNQGRLDIIGLVSYTKFAGSCINYLGSHNLPRSKLFYNSKYTQYKNLYSAGMCKSHTRTTMSALQTALKS